MVKLSYEIVTQHLIYQNPAVSIKEVSFTFRGTADMREYKFLVDAFTLFFKRL